MNRLKIIDIVFVIVAIYTEKIISFVFNENFGFLDWQIPFTLIIISLVYLALHYQLKVYKNYHAYILIIPIIWLCVSLWINITTHTTHQNLSYFQR